MADLKLLERERLGLRKLRSPGTRRVLAGLRQALEANGAPPEGRFVQYGTEDSPHAVVMGVAAGHSGAEDYQAAFPAEQTQEK